MIAEARFMTFEEIVEMGEEGFRTAYLRMILRYRRCQIEACIERVFR